MKKLQIGKLFVYAILLIVIVVLIYYGYRYYKLIKLGKSTGSFLEDIKNAVVEPEENSQMPVIPPMPEELEEIETVDEFLQGVEYFQQPIQFGYDLKMLKNKRAKLDAMSKEELKRFYQLAKEKLSQKSESENAEFMSILEKIYS